VSVEGNDVGVAVLGMSGFRLLEAREVEGELELVVETDAAVVGCTGRGVRAESHGRRDTLGRDLPVAGRSSRLRWRKRLWRCHEPLCERSTWTERSEHIAPRAALTERAKTAICVQVGREGDSVAAVARAYGVGWQTAMHAVVERGAPLVDDPARLDGVTALGLDETAFLRASRSHPTLYVTGMVDARTGRLLDVVKNRTAAAVSTWLADRDQAWKARIDTVAIDPYQGYKRALVGHLDHATLVADHWHVIRLGNAMVDDVRRRVQQDTLGHRGRKGDPLYGIRRTLLFAADRLSDRQWQRLDAAWDAGDPRDEVHLAWAVKEALREIYAADCIEVAREALAEFHSWAADSGLPEARRLARTVRRWEAPILAWHTTNGATNARVEAVNLLVKKIKRVGHGFRNFDNYRLRLLLHCGVDWHTPRAARIRGRSPRFAA
jgi:transposase